MNGSIHFVLVALMASCLPYCALYPTEEEVQNKLIDQGAGTTTQYGLFVLDVPEEAESISAYVLPVIVPSREGQICADDRDCLEYDAMSCEGGTCVYTLNCFDFMGEVRPRSVFDFSYAFVVKPEERLVDGTDRAELVLDGLPPGRLLIFLEAFGRHGDPLSHGCGMGQGNGYDKVTIRIRLTESYP
jgi:hypothetical protein